MGLLGKIADGIEIIADTMNERLDPVTILKEMGAGLDKMVAQGAAEVGQSLFTGNAYMPYGPTQAPIELAEASPPVTSNTQSYEQMLESYSPPQTPVVQKETEMER